MTSRRRQKNPTLIRMMGVGLLLVILLLPVLGYFTAIKLGRRETMMSVELVKTPPPPPAPKERVRKKQPQKAHPHTEARKSGAAKAPPANKVAFKIEGNAGKALGTGPAIQGSDTGVKPGSIVAPIPPAGSIPSAPTPPAPAPPIPPPPPVAPPHPPVVEAPVTVPARAPAPLPPHVPIFVAA